MKRRVYPDMPYGLDLKRLYTFLRAPVRITLGQGSGCAKQFSIVRPGVWVLMIVVLCLGFVMLLPSQHIQYQQRIAQLQYEQRHLTSKLSETEAMLALRNSKLESMQQELTRNAHDMYLMQQRLTMLDDVLAARKVGGWHILHPTAYWQDAHTIAYQLVVVKGGNYPRWAKGNIRFSVLGQHGKSIPLDNKRGKKSRMFDMTSHAFFEGVIPWSKGWQAKTLIVSLMDKRKKNNQTIEVPILTTQSLDQATAASVDDASLPGNHIKQPIKKEFP